MIAEIKKYTFLVHHRDYKDLLDLLRDAGAVHIIEKRKLEEDSDPGKELKLLRKYKEAIQKLSVLVPGTGPVENNSYPAEALDEYESLVIDNDEAKHHIEVLKPEAEKSKPWGNFDINIIEKLKESGWLVSFFSCSEKKFKEGWKVDYPLEIISRERGKLFFVIIHKENEPPVIRAEQLEIPERSAGSVLEEIERYEKRIEDNKSAIEKNAPGWLYSLNKGIDDIMSRFEYSEAAGQADKYAGDNLYVLEGWIPKSDEEKVLEMLQDSDCYYFVSDPAPDEKIPVILNNNRFASLFEPITKLFNLPDYKELDLTPFFAPFFMLFFGFCLGDGGYGLLFVVAGFIIKRKIDRKFRPIITLAQYFGVAAIVMGLLSGTFFGINLIDSGYVITGQSMVQMKDEGIPENMIQRIGQVKDIKFETRQNYINEVVKVIGEDNYSKYQRIILKNAESDLPVLNSVRHYMLDSMNLFYLAMIIGALQIIFGMILKIINITRMKGFRYSLATLGWVILIFTLIIFKGGGMLKLINEEQLKPLFIGFLAVAGILIFFLNSPDLNIFVRVGKGVWDSYNVITGVFGDLLSYIRLFALGISSSILGYVFNQISLQLLSVPYAGWLLCLILLIVGHTLNIAIATLGSFVHPMRLTFVEFYKNTGFTGGGIEYKPFKIKQ